MFNFVRWLDSWLIPLSGGQNEIETMDTLKLLDQTIHTDRTRTLRANLFVA